MEESFLAEQRKHTPRPRVWGSGEHGLMAGMSLAWAFKARLGASNTVAVELCRRSGFSDFLCDLHSNA